MAKRTAKDGPEAVSPVEPGAAPAPTLRRPVLFLVAVLIVAAGLAGAWRVVGPRIAADPARQLTVEAVRLPERPAWIRADVRGEAFRDAGVTFPRSILEPGLAELVAKSLALHPWVAEVEQVRLVPPAGAEVRLRYRRPACVVAGASGLYALDDEAVILPAGDFSDADLGRLPRLANVRPGEGPAGVAWRGAATLGGARLGRVVGDRWTALALERIEPLPAPADRVEETEYALFTRSGVRILWGHAPGDEYESEAPVEEKLRRLDRLSEKFAGFQAAETPGEIDLRNRNDIVVGAHPRAQAPAPPRQ